MDQKVVDFLKTLYDAPVEVGVNKMGSVYPVKNKSKQAPENAKYFQLKVQLPDGEEDYLLFTAYELSKGKTRALKNTEDIIPVSKARDLVD